MTLLTGKMLKHRLLFMTIIIVCAAGIVGPAMALTPAPCPAFTGCTAKDVTTTLTAAEVLSPNRMCESGNTIRLNLTVTFDARSTRRDVGVYVANDGKILLDPVDPATVCSGDYGYIPPFLDIDGGGDTCGDINGVVAWTFNTTVPCNGGQYNVSQDLVISSCRFWEQPGANNFCTNLTQTSPGTSSKCDCSPFAVTPALSFCATTNCDDGNACTADSCDETANRCVNTPMTCNDGNACTTDTCDPASGCVYTPVTCTALDQCHTAGTCDPGTGTCSNPAAPDGTACTDGSLCTQIDTCQAGTCTGTNPVVCTALDQCHVAGTCDPATGFCSDPAAPDGTGCTDGNACTTVDTCQTGVCLGASPVVCTALDQCHVAGTCDPGSGTCSNPPIADGTACNDGNACTAGDTCTSGVCSPGTGTVCTALDQCHVAGTCDPVSGTCSNPAAPDGTTCNDGNPCTTGDTCTSGVCSPGTGTVCTAVDQCHVAGTCDPGTGTCSNPPIADGTACNDGDLCTQTDACQAGVCTGANPVVCTALDQCQVAGTCDPLNGTCSNPAAPNDTACNDGNACTTVDTCQTGTCTGSNPVACTALDQCHVAGTCDPVSGTCSNPAAADGTGCNDSNACTQTDVCQAGACAGTNPVVCTAVDQCHVPGTCDPVSGACSNPAMPDGMICSDGNACTIPDICLAGSCLPGPALNCDDANACTADVCDPAFGLCVHTDNSARCNDNNACTGDICDTSIGCINTDNSARCNDSNACTNDSCDPAAGCAYSSVICGDSNACTTDTCDPATGCGYPLISCDDGNPCTTDSCNAATGCVHVDDCCRPSQCRSICSSIGVGTIWSGIPTPAGNGCAGTAVYWLGNPCMLNPIFSPAASGGCNFTFSTGYVNVTTADAARHVLENTACAVCEKTAGNETVTWENPLNPLYRQTLSTELSMNNCIGSRWANPKDVRPVLLDVEDFLLETSCQDGCNLTRAQADQISAWNSYLGEFNAGRFWNGPEPCLPCALPTTSPAPTQQLNAYILLK